MFLLQFLHLWKTILGFVVRCECCSICQFPEYDLIAIASIIKHFEGYVMSIVALHELARWQLCSLPAEVVIFAELNCTVYSLIVWRFIGLNVFFYHSSNWTNLSIVVFVDHFCFVTPVSEWVEFNAPLDTIQVISEAETCHQYLTAFFVILILVVLQTGKYSVEEGYILSCFTQITHSHGSASVL